MIIIDFRADFVQNPSTIWGEAGFQEFIILFVVSISCKTLRGVTFLNGNTIPLIRNENEWTYYIVEFLHGRRPWIAGV